MKTIEVTLFHADWCHHCKVFKPEWKNLLVELDKYNKNKHNEYRIIAKEYEEQSLSSLSDDETLINGQPIQGFPTIKIKCSDKKKHVDYEYDGQRTSEHLLTHLTKFAFDNLKNH